MERIARFRANPAKIRIAIRRTDGMWRASVSRRIDSSCEFVYSAPFPAEAIDLALGAAEAASVDGIDLGMGWAYRHPQSTSAEGQ